MHTWCQSVVNEYADELSNSVVGGQRLQAFYRLLDNLKTDTREKKPIPILFYVDNMTTLPSAHHSLQTGHTHLVHCIQCVGFVAKEVSAVVFVPVQSHMYQLHTNTSRE